MGGGERYVGFYSRGCRCRGHESPGGGGGTPNFSAYVGSGLASTLHPQKYVGFYSSRCRCRGHESPGGGGTFNFSAYVGSGLASTLHLKKYQEFLAPPKNI